MLQSYIEIMHYSFEHFDHIPVFKALYHWSCVKGRAHSGYIDTSAFTKHVWALPEFSASIVEMKLKYVAEYGSILQYSSKL